MSQQMVKVVVRVRPFLEKQKIKKNHQFFTYDLHEKYIVVESGNEGKRKRKIFCFDDVFVEDSQQQQVFEKTGRKLVEDVIQGYNGTIFAYGQTGSGKTYTMMGNTKNQLEKGIIPRCFEYVLAQAKQNTHKDFLIMFSFIEIYNEQIYDLLINGAKTRLELRQSPDYGVFIKDVKKLAITSEEEIYKYIKIGMQNRVTAQTLMNSESSRSHSIFTIYVESLQKINEASEKLIGSKFNLVDLAGSERQHKGNFNTCSGSGERFFETTKINLSLTALGKVITYLVQGKGAFIPYRDSKLTRLLQDSLGGNSKTIMLATISPLPTSIDQTLSTLKYASKAKYITNAPIINQDPKDALLLEYEKQIKKLRGKLSEIQEYSEINQLKEEKEKLTKMAEEEKQQLLEKIRELEEKVISPNELSEKLLKERNKREMKLSYMQKNYCHLELEVKEMRELLTELRRKYKNASKQIFQLENQYERQRSQMEQQNQKLTQQNILYKSIVDILFTPKQLSHVISLGTWQNQRTFLLPKFYFKDRNTLAFPCDDEPEPNRQKENYWKRSTSKSKTLTTKSIKSLNRHYYPYRHCKNQKNDF